MIFVSAGHHEAAQGAQWVGNTEWTEAVLWRDAIIKYLDGDAGVIVPSGPLKDKVDFINAGHAVCAIEIHFNSAIKKRPLVGDDGEPIIDDDGREAMETYHVGKGCETLYYPGSKKGKELAKTVQKALTEQFPPNRGIKEGWYRQDYPGRVDYHGDKDGDEKIDYILRKTHCPTVIVEPEFIHRIDMVRRRRAITCLAIAKQLNHLVFDTWGL